MIDLWMLFPWELQIFGSVVAVMNWFLLCSIGAEKVICFLGDESHIFSIICGVVGRIHALLLLCQKLPVVTV